VAAIDTVFTQGALQTTGVNTDVALQGNGFFILKDGDKSFYTRAGSFGLDSNGTLVNPSTGLKVQGWMAQTINGQSIVKAAGDTTQLNIPIGSKDPAKATTNVDFACNLDKNLAVLTPTSSVSDTQKNTWPVDKSVYDTFGNVHRLVVTYQRDPNAPDVPNQWLATVKIDPENTTFDNKLGVGFGTPPAGNTYIVKFGNDGALASVTDSAGQIRNTGDLSIPLTFTVQGSNAGQPGATQTMNLNIGKVGAYENSTTQFADKSSNKSFRQDGYGMGYLENFGIDGSGQVTGVYSNGTNRVLGQVALASFTNPGGLEKAGESTYAKTNNSGDANVGASGTAGKGKFISGALEMANVDLADAFTDMIVTQRGFQANSRTIQTADQMIQELLGLKR
jgi:flagellar hook protein FlgE